ncbi:unnamed protein product [Tuber melanosporum]|uniref:(Perigord truffle) hypothetical protein n=1 Tax=Tuber melanosporum (strain Mel28) TaxID=656061 RepID=D5GAG0_TUBMM|nr:uncharacterized protein GSTUM_00005272001 [Tuber melanosporum]CAZ81503.1 unnamed protein product [Tuber melanosporum]
MQGEKRQEMNDTHLRGTMQLTSNAGSYWGKSRRKVQICRTPEFGQPIPQTNLIDNVRSEAKIITLRVRGLGEFFFSEDFFPSARINLPAKEGQSSVMSKIFFPAGGSDIMPLGGITGAGMILC